MNRYLISLIALVVLIAWIFPGEAVKWQLADAQNDLQAEQFDEAVQKLKAISEASPDDLNVQLQCLQGMGIAKNRQEFESLGRQLISKFQGNRALASVLAIGFHEFGSHALAYRNLLVAHELTNEPSGSNRIGPEPLTLIQANNLGYFSFLAQKDTNYWYRELKRVIQVRQEVNFAIYRSEALRLVDKPDRASAILSEQLDRLQALQQQLKSQWQRDVMQWMSNREWPNEEPEHLEKQRHNLMNLQVLIARVAKQGWITTDGTDDLQLRERFRKAKIFDSLAPDLEIASEGDSRTAELFSDISSPKKVCDQLNYWVTLFDTRGCLALANGDHQQAMSDFDSSIEALTLVQALSESVDIWNTTDIMESDELEKKKQEKRASWAAIYYHRIQLKQVLGDNLTQQDQKRIRDLGFDPSQPIY